MYAIFNVNNITFYFLILNYFYLSTLGLLAKIFFMKGIGLNIYDSNLKSLTI